MPTSLEDKKSLLDVLKKVKDRKYSEARADLDQYMEDEFITPSAERGESTTLPSLAAAAIGAGAEYISPEDGESPAWAAASLVPAGKIAKGVAKLGKKVKDAAKRAVNSTEARKQKELNEKAQELIMKRRGRQDNTIEDDATLREIWRTNEENAPVLDYSKIMRPKRK